MTQAGTDAKAGDFARTFLTIGVLSFGGPAGQIATLHRELVERRGWIDDAMFLRALNLCMLLPGPEAQQLATWCGWRLRGVRGGLVAGLSFVAPGALVMAVLTSLYIGFGRLAAVQATFAGVQAAVVAIVAHAVLRVARRALRSGRDRGLAAAAFALITLFAVPFPLVVALAALAGRLSGTPAPAASAPAPGTAGWTAALRTALVWLAIWLAPLGLLAAALGPSHDLAQLGAFFARLAAVSFGGAYAGLAYVAQGAGAGSMPGLSGWVTPAEIVDALALAETTPGPLVLVYQFIGGLAGHRIHGPWPAWGGAAIGMALVLWMTFAPSFLCIFALAPQMERLMARPGLARALRGVTAAVVGVMASLGLWFALHVLFGVVEVVAMGPLRLWTPVGAIDPFAVGVAVGALALLVRSGMVPVLVLAGLAGMGRWLLNS